MLMESFVPPVHVPPMVAPSGLGVLRAIRSNVLDLWPAEAYRRPYFVNDIGFGKSVFLLNHPEHVRHVLVENEDKYSRSPIRVRILKPMIGKGLLLSEGQEWRKQRRVLAPVFAPRAVPTMARLFAEGAQRTAREMHSHGAHTLDLFKFLNDWSFRVTASSMFSIEDDADLGALQAIGHRYMRHLARPFMLDVLMPMNWPSPHDLLRGHYSRQWMRKIQMLVDRRLTRPAAEVPVDLLDMLRNAKDEAGQPAFTPGELRDQVATMLVAGHETTSIAMFWSLLLLAQYPRIQGRVADEVRGLDLSREGIDGSFSQLTYTRAVVSEALRLYPPAFMIVRQALENDQVGNLKIPAGSTVMVAPWVLHRHRDFWSEPNRFEPERFLPGAPQVPRYSYLPFGVGPRVCVGAQFALAEATIMIASLIQRFTFEVEGDRPVLPKCVATARPDHYPNVRILPRADLVTARVQSSA